MNRIDLQLEGSSGAGELTAFLSSPDGLRSFAVPWPTRLEALQRSWRDRFLAHHDPARHEPPADVVREWGQRLARGLAEWLAEPAWSPLRQVLEHHPALPLTVGCHNAPAPIEQLPWDVLALDRPIWRLSPPISSTAISPLRIRQPRVLLVVGSEQDLDLRQEISQLESLARRGRIALLTLRGSASSVPRVRKALANRVGWDALVFLGHSAPDPQGGGRLQLGDGDWVAADVLSQALEGAAANGLPLVLLNSCSGIDLARSCNAAGIPWALCFREAVPTRAPALAFSALLAAMENGEGLIAALALARRELEDHGPTGSHLLLSAYATPVATDLQLPLRRRRQLRRRLATSQWPQAMAAAAALLLAAVGEIEPSNPLSTYLLDRRLDIQTIWRRHTRQPGPQAPPLPVLLLDAQRSIPELGVTPTPGRTSRLALARVLERTPPPRVPVVGLDVVLDGPGPGTEELARVIRGQRRRLVVAGFIGADGAAEGAGDRSRPLPSLIQAGLEARDLSVGTVGGGVGLQPVPMQLRTPITAAMFAAALSTASAPHLPVDAVLDWSLDWSRLIRPVAVAELASLQAHALVVGGDGRIDPARTDLFHPPAAVRQALAGWGGSSREIPGAMVQAVLAQSLSMQHWLMPCSLTLATGLAAALGVLVAAVQPRPSGRMLVIAAAAGMAVPLALQLAVTQKRLVPLLLPLAALGTTTLVRREGR